MERTWSRASTGAVDYTALATGLAATELWSPETLDHGYYHGLRFMIDAVGPHGTRIPLIDGGAFDWLEKLLSNRKMIFVASALGSQSAAHLFSRRPPGSQE